MLDRLAQNAPPLIILIVGIPILFFYAIYIVFKFIGILIMGTESQREEKAEAIAAAKAAEWKPTGKTFKKPGASQEWL